MHSRYIVIVSFATHRVGEPTGDSLCGPWPRSPSSAPATSDLTTGACLAHLGHEVVCADIDAGKVEQLSNGQIPIVEAGLEELVEEGLATGRLRFVLGAANAASDCEFVYLCVPTPQGDDGSADLCYIEAAAREIAPVLPYEAIVVNKSTVPVGSTQGRRAGARPPRRLGRVQPRVPPRGLRRARLPASRPRRRRQRRPVRGASGSPRCTSAFAAPFIVTDPASAETIKYAANAFLATKLSFVNAIAAVCEARRRRRQRRRARHGLRQAHRPRVPPARPRLGRLVLPEGHPGARADRRGRRLRLRPARGRDRRQRASSSSAWPTRSATAAGGSLGAARSRVWGLTFKARTDDLRDSPALAIIERLVAARRHGAGLRPNGHGPRPAASRSAPTRTRPARTPTCSPCSPSGTSSAGSTSTRSPRAMSRLAIVDARNLLDRNDRRRAYSITRALAADPVELPIMSRARARSLWLAAPALLAACSSSPGTQASTTEPLSLSRNICSEHVRNRHHSPTAATGDGRTRTIVDAGAGEHARARRSHSGADPRSHSGTGRFPPTPTSWSPSTTATRATPMRPCRTWLADADGRSQRAGCAAARFPTHRGDQLRRRPCS